MQSNPEGCINIIRLALTSFILLLAIPGAYASGADYERPDRRELLQKIAGQIKEKSIILFHAGVSDTMSMLPELLDELRARGIQFDSL